MNNQMNQGQMSQMIGRINVGPGTGAINHQNMGNQMGPMNPSGMPQMAPNNMVQQQQMGPNVMNTQIPINQINQQNMGPNQMTGGPMGMNPMMNIQQQHMARKPQEMMMNNNQTIYQGKFTRKPLIAGRKMFKIFSPERRSWSILPKKSIPFDYITGKYCFHSSRSNGSKSGARSLTSNAKHATTKWLT